MNEINITVLYDNNPYKRGLKMSWGFACLVQGMEKTVLFDTGGDSPTLLANMRALDVDPEEIDLIVLSHIHGDHVGGLKGILAENPNVTVYVPPSFPLRFKREVRRLGAELTEAGEPTLICEGVYLTGEMGTSIKEQGLILCTPGGAAVITGCAHPGIVDMVARAKEVARDDLLLVMGGFDLGSTSQRDIARIISSFQALGVRYAGPCHCSGDTARRLFAEAYGQRYIETGVGKVIKLDTLE